jgi:hypothetical protein
MELSKKEQASLEAKITDLVTKLYGIPTDRLKTSSVNFELLADMVAKATVGQPTQ